MPTDINRSKKLKTVVSFGGVVAVILIAMAALGMFEKKSEPAVSTTEPGAITESAVPAPGTALLEPEPTDTVISGVIATESTGAQDTMFLTVDGVRIPLALDEHSYCNSGSGGLPCMAMSSLFSQSFGGKRVMIDGTMQGDTLLARRLRVLDANETPRGTPGSVYIPWVRVHDMILACEVKSLLQTHEGLVYTTLKNGKKYVAVEPVIDEVFTVAHEATTACGDIGLGTE